MKRFNLFFLKLYRNCLSLIYFTPIAALLVVFVVASCSTTKRSATQKQKIEMISDKDSTEYTLGDL